MLTMCGVLRVGLFDRVCLTSVILYDWLVWRAGLKAAHTYHSVGQHKGMLFGTRYSWTI